MSLLLVGRPLHSARRKGQRVIRGARGSSRIAAGLYAELKKALGPMLEEMAGLAPWLASNPGTMAALSALGEQQEKYRRILGPSIRGIVGRWKKAIDERDKIKLQASLARAIGVQAVEILDEAPVRDVVELMGSQAVHLISKDLETYYNDIKEAVFKSYQQKPLPEGRNLIEEIQKIGQISYERAKLIAVDQTNKMQGMVTQARQVSLGIEEYIWRTAEDQRVVGNPSGLYPVGTRLHGNHYERRGKKFRWDSPPPDGHPGWPIRCRCYADPVIDYDKIKLAA